MDSLLKREREIERKEKKKKRDIQLWVSLKREREIERKENKKKKDIQLWVSSICTSSDRTKIQRTLFHKMLCIMYNKLILIIRAIIELLKKLQKRKKKKS